ncbi:hypothetical protein JCM10908_002573 [Rhodotorula pacifica]|uniref:uncharacterized protein n=1 Tax=Rhodotorula pacifica TaxID=1495444 RepID=UPI003175DB10
MSFTSTTKSPAASMHEAQPEPSLPALPSDNSVATEDAAEAAATAEPSKRKPLAFWMVFVALCFSCFVSALDLTAVSTTLPDIAETFHSKDYSWIGSAYALTSTAFVPWTGGLANIFGRRPVMLAGLLLFALGSALTGAAQSMAMAIAGRSVQGIGGGAILTMVEIIVCDLVPLAERGAYFGIIGCVWALASAIGPPIGGALASANQWRWLFYLNLPLCALAIALVIFFLDVKAPQSTLREKLEQMDFYNVIFVAAVTSLILALTWGGSTYAWSSGRVLAPLILGIVGIVAFIFIERSFVKYPTVPFDILRSRTSLLGYATTFLHSAVMMLIVYYLPTAIFQAAKEFSPIRSGTALFSFCFTVAPFAILTGAWVTITQKYKLQNLVGWCFACLGSGLLILIKWDSSKQLWASIPVVVGIGMGILYTGTQFAVLAPLAPRQQPHAIAFFGFIRALGQVFGISIGATALQNELKKKLPSAFLAELGGSAEAAFAAIPRISSLPEPTRTLVRAAFADSAQVLWIIGCAFAGAALILSFFLEDLTLATTADKDWGLKEQSAKKAASAQGVEEEKIGSRS